MVISRNHLASCHLAPPFERIFHLHVLVDIMSLSFIVSFLYRTKHSVRLE